MVKLVFCVRRNPALTREDFQEYWLEQHGRLVKSLRDAIPGMRRYVQSHILETPANTSVRASRGTKEPYDGITEVWFEEIGAPSTEASAEAGRRLLADEATFIDFADSAVFYTIEHEIF
jgi:uncharacterized protein (TIGR02118 family)